MNSNPAIGEAISSRMAELDGEDGMLTEWLCIGVRQTLDEGGQPVTAVGILMSDESMPMFKVLGLIDYAQTAYRARLHRMALEDGE